MLRLFWSAGNARLSFTGQVMIGACLFIASTAPGHGATLVTGNRRHDARIPGLGVEDGKHA